MHLANDCTTFKKSNEGKTKNGERILWGKHFTIPHFSPFFPIKNRHKDGEKWGKMGENGERILWGKHFTIPHFSPFFPIKKNFERRSVFFKMA